MVGLHLRRRGIAVAGQIGGYDAKVLDQPLRDRVPHDVGLGISMQKQEGRSAAADAHSDPVLGAVEPEFLEHDSIVSHCADDVSMVIHDQAV